MEMLIHWIWYSARSGMDERERIRLLEHFHSAEDIYDADETVLRRCEGMTGEMLASLLDKELTGAESVLARCAKEKIHILTWNDTDYPSRLRGICDPPVILYYKGTLPEFTRTAAVGVVGTRKASAYGLSVARRLGCQLGRCGGIVVTGLAYGIDAMAAAGALQGGGAVVGVLGSGVDKVYPAANRALFSQVAGAGCLISEYPPGTPPQPWRFPRRNRLISGISCGVVVVEAPEKSGALITARCALEQGRDVFVVPGNLGTASCAGSNRLLRDGAVLVTCGWDVLSEYAERYPDGLRQDTGAEPLPQEPWKQAEVAQPAVPVKPENLPPVHKNPVDKAAFSPYSGVSTAGLSDGEKRLLALLGPDGQPVDALIDRSGIPASDALAALTTLEIRGFTRSLPGNRVALK